MTLAVQSGVKPQYNKQQQQTLHVVFALKLLICKCFEFGMGSVESYCWVKPQLYTKQFRLLMTLRKKSFESRSIVEKGEDAGNQHFLLFPQCFLPSKKQILILKPYLVCLLQ